MNRRELLATTSAFTFLAAVPRLASAGNGPVAYSREAYERSLASGEPFLLDFYAAW